MVVASGAGIRVRAGAGIRVRAGAGIRVRAGAGIRVGSRLRAPTCLFVVTQMYWLPLQTRCRTHAAALLAFVMGEALGSRPAPGTPSGAFNLFAPERDSTLKKGHPGDADQREPDMGGAENVGRKGVTWGARGGENLGRAGRG